MAGQFDLKSKTLMVAPPLFLKISDLPFNVRDIEILKQAEIIAGKGKAKVAQRMAGMWRLHMVDRHARDKVLGVGMTIRGKAIPTFDINPNFFRDSEGNLIETTKLTVENIPISIGHDDVIDHLKRFGVEPTSGFDWVNCRDADNSLKSDWFNGNRFIYIKKPSIPLPEIIFIGKFRAFLNHPEQVSERACTNCQEKGHRTRKCKNPALCIDCNEKGHKKGDPKCKFVPNDSEENQHEHQSDDQGKSSSHTRQENKEDGELSDDNLSNISSDEDAEEITTQIKTKQVVLNLDELNKVITTSVPFQVQFNSETQSYENKHVSNNDKIDQNGQEVNPVIPEEILAAKDKPIEEENGEMEINNQEEMFDESNKKDNETENSELVSNTNVSKTSDENEKKNEIATLNMLKELIEKKKEIEQSLVNSEESKKSEKTPQLTSGKKSNISSNEVSEHSTKKNEKLKKQRSHDNLKLLQNMTIEDLKALSEEDLRKMVNEITIETRNLKSNIDNAKESKTSKQKKNKDQQYKCIFTNTNSRKPKNSKKTCKQQYIFFSTRRQLKKDSKT